MTTELTQADRDRAEAWMKASGKEPKRMAVIPEYPERWCWAQSWGDDGEPPHKIHPLLISSMEHCIFLSRPPAIDAIAVVLRDLRTLLGVDAEVQAAREKDAKLARDMGSDAIAAARAEEAEACIAEYAERFPWSPFRAMAEHAIRARHRDPAQ